MKDLSLRAALAAMLLIAGCSEGTTGSAPPPGSPAAPSNLEGTLTPNRSTQLTWVDASDDETGFRVEVSLGGDWEAHTEVAADATEYEALAYRYDSTYHWRVRAFNGDGASNPSNVVTLQTPEAPPAPTGCGLVIGDDLGLASARSNPDGGWFWVWAIHSGIEQVVAEAPFTSGGSEVVLDGGSDGTTFVGVARRDLGRTLELDLQLRFSELEVVESGYAGDLCLMLHDLARGGYERDGLHADSRVAFPARLPSPGVMPVIPGRGYWMTITIDRLARTFDVWVGDVPIAGGVPVDGVLVVPSVYIER